MIMMKNTDQPPKIMHFCKVCKKGFSSGGALGGHMRGHGIEDVNTGNNEEHLMSELRDKRPYFLRTTTNRFVSTYRAREGGGRSFLTWNSLVDEQGKYNQRLQVSTPISPPESFRRSTIMEKYNRNGASREENDLANCLVMLSNGKDNSVTLAEDKEVVVKGMFQCKACKKVFNSHQALGGHRASHKKVKGCFAARYDNTDNDDMAVEDLLESPTIISPLIDLNLRSEAPFVSDHSKRKSKVHECSICHRVFSSGQALGGHKRCHWLAFNMPDTYSIPQFHGFQYDSQQLFKQPMFKESQPVLDLNLPALLEDKNKAHGLSGNNPLNFEALTGICRDNRKNNEEHCEVKLAKLSDLRDINLDGECSTWLQVGIAPTSYGRTAS